MNFLLSTSYLDEYGRLKIKEDFIVYETTSAPAKGKLQAGDSIKEMRIAGGEWMKLTRRYHLIDNLLNVEKGDVVELKLLDSHGNERMVSITFDKDEYFAKYN